MSHVRYEPIIDDIMEHRESEEEEEEVVDHPQIYLMRMASVKGTRWPTAIGVAHMILGFLISFLGLLEVVVVPISENRSAKVDEHTCWGAGLWAGILMVLTGSTAIRATLSKRRTTVIRFYNLTIITLLIYFGLTILLFVAYANGWTTQDAYPPTSRMHQIHMMVTVFMVLGLVFALTAVVQYYDVLCCGEVQLWRWWLEPLLTCRFSCCRRSAMVRRLLGRGHEQLDASVDHLLIQ